MNDNQNLEITVNENMEEIKRHGNLDYPVAVYPTDLRKMYLGIVRWHWHPEIEFIYVISGEADFGVAEKNYVLTAGQGLFINRNVLHGVHARTGKNCFFCSIVFHPTFLFGYRHTSLSTLYMLPMVNDNNLSHIVFEDVEAPILSLMRRMITLDEEKPFAYELRMQSLLLESWVMLLQQHEEYVQNLPTLSNPAQATDEIRVKDAISFITSHYAEPLTLQDIADSIHISKSECCRCFKRILSLSPFEYLLKYRIYSAVFILDQAEEKIAVSDIASRCGFNSSSYFNKIFKKYMGCTPSSYKQTKQTKQPQRGQNTKITLPFAAHVDQPK